MASPSPSTIAASLRLQCHRRRTLIPSLPDAPSERHPDARAQVAERAVAVPARQRRRLAPRRPVPASYNDLFADAAVRDHVGDVWYQTTVRVPRGLGRRADRAALRRRHPPRRRLGRRPARWPSTRAATRRSRPTSPTSSRPASEHRITVSRRTTSCAGTRSRRASSRTTPDGPPAALLPRLLQLRRAAPHGVAVLDAARPTSRDVTVVTDLDGRRVVATRSTRRTRGRARRYAARRRGRRGRARRGRGAASCASPEPRCGGPATATCTSSPSSCWGRRRAGRRLPGAGRASARSRSTGTRFLINGEPFYFRGFGRHEDTAVRGKGARRRAHGARLRAHGVDRRELVPHLALPLRRGGARLRRPARHRRDRRDGGGRASTSGSRRDLGDSRFATFSEETIGDATREAQRAGDRASSSRATRTTRAWCMWSIANEPESRRRTAAREYFEPLVDRARRLDPSRPVGLREHDARADPDKDAITDLFDVVMLNRYYGWYVDHRRPRRRRARSSRRSCAAWAAKHGKPIMMTEYGADTLAGLHGDLTRCRGPRSTRRRCSRCPTGCSTASTRSSASRYGTSPTSRPAPGDPPRGRQQEGRLHPRPAPEGRGPPAAPPLARHEHVGEVGERERRLPQLRHVAPGGAMHRLVAGRDLVGAVAVVAGGVGGRGERREVEPDAVVGGVRAQVEAQLGEPVAGAGERDRHALRRARDRVGARGVHPATRLEAAGGVAHQRDLVQQRAGHGDAVEQVRARHGLAQRRPDRLPRRIEQRALDHDHRVAGVERAHGVRVAAGGPGDEHAAGAAGERLRRGLDPALAADGDDVGGPVDRPELLGSPASAATWGPPPVTVILTPPPSSPRARARAGRARSACRPPPARRARAARRPPRRRRCAATRPGSR